MKEKGNERLTLKGFDNIEALIIFIFLFELSKQNRPKKIGAVLSFLGILKKLFTYFDLPISKPVQTMLEATALFLCLQ